MANTKWLIGIILLALGAGAAFANGSVDDNGNVIPGPRRFSDPATETFEGRFSLVDDRYPALVTKDGDTYYLMVHFPLDESEIPEEGAQLKIEAFRSPMSPVNLMVVSAEVDGKELALDDPRWRDDWGAPRGRGGFAGPRGRGGMMGGYGFAGPRGRGGMMGGGGFGYGDCPYDDDRGWGRADTDD